MSDEGISGKHSRRDFLRYSRDIAGTAALLSTVGKVAGAVPGPNSTLDAEDYPVITTTNDLEDITVREVRDHAVYSSQVGLPLVSYLNDDVGGTGGWDLLGYSENLETFQPGITGNLLASPVAIPSDLAEQFYTMDYRGRHDFNKPAGMTHTIEDQIDRYKTDLTITYVVNGSTETVTVNIPNVVAKQLFGWDPDDPIPFYNQYGLDPLTQPSEFEEAMSNLHQVLTDEGLEDSIMKNRNTGLPPLPDPNPWYETRQLLIDLGVDPLQHDDLYPTGMLLEMTDYRK